MRKKTVTAITVILTLAVVAGFAVGPMVNPTNLPPAKPGTYAPMGAYYSPLASAINEHYEILKDGKDAEITGTITNIIYGNGRMPTEITIKTADSKEYEVELGPIWMFNATQLVLNTQVKVNGKELDSKVVAFSITFANNQLVQLRTNEGLPVWAGRNANARRVDWNRVKERVEQYIRNHRGYQGQMSRPGVPYLQNRR